MDECLKEEKAKSQGATGNAALRTGYTTTPGLYQPTVQERAMDECLKKEKSKLQRATGNAASHTGHTAAP